MAVLGGADALRELVVLRGAALAVAARLGVAVAAGAAWGGPDELLALVPFVFAAFWWARTRAEAWWIVGTYYCVGTRGMFVGATRFFDISVFVAAFLVVACAAVVAAAWALCWTPRENRARATSVFVRTFGIVALTTLPPLGAAAVPHPLSAAGVWFPGTGMWGLGALIVAAAGMASARGCWLCAMIAIAGALRGPLVAPPSALQGISTELGARRDDVGDYLRQWFVAQHAMRRVEESRARAVVLPEGVGGLWSRPMQELWRDTDRRLRAQGRTALVGVTYGSAIEPLAAGVVALGATHGQYRQRVPMPLAMWRPGSSSFAPRWFGTGTLNVVEGTSVRRLGLFVCWEIGVVWCVLQAIFEGAEVLVVAANGAWLEGTSAPRAQAQMLTLWGALFALPTVLATNS